MPDSIVPGHPAKSLYVERRGTGYVVVQANDHNPLTTTFTQQEGINWCKLNHPDWACHVARVENVHGGHPDHWRRVH